MTLDEISTTCFNEFKTIVHDLTGIHLDENKKIMFSGRVRKRILELKLKSYETYLQYYKENKNDEKNVLVNLITTNETYFYRTPRVWDYVENSFLPERYKSGRKRITAWSAASSTGDEAHTLGIILQSFSDNNLGFDYVIKGTDISSDVIDISTKGIYNGRSIKRFRESKSELFKKYMKGNDDEGYRVLPAIKSKITFATHNLFNVYNKAEKFDLIFLRNVLIYFTKIDQEKVLQNISQKLAPNGLLIIGESESLGRINTDFELIAPFIYGHKGEKSNLGAA